MAETEFHSWVHKPSVRVQLFASQQSCFLDHFKSDGNVKLSFLRISKTYRIQLPSPNHNWRNRHFLQLPQLSYFFSKKLVLLYFLQFLFFYSCISRDSYMSFIIIYYHLFYHSLCWCSFCASAGRKPCTWSISHSSQSFCLYTQHLSEDSRRSHHVDLLNLCHSSSL